MSPDYPYPCTNASTCYALMGKYDDALRCAGFGKDADPNAFVAYLTEGAAWFYRANHDRAREAWKEGRARAEEETKGLFEVALGWLDAIGGDVGAARARAVVAAHRDDDRWLHGLYGSYFISLCSLAGEHDLAVEFLRRQKTYASSYRYLVSDRTLAALRGHSGFHSLLEERHEVWKGLVDEWGQTLEFPPEQQLSAPQEYLEAGDNRLE